MTASPSSAIADALTRSDLNRIDQTVGLICSVYPNDADFDVVVDMLESAGLSKQNRTRLRTTLKGSRFVSLGSTKNTFRGNPRFVDQIRDKIAPVIGAPKAIVVDDSAALIPASVLSRSRPYIAAIVKQINEGYVAHHFDSVSVMLRRLCESLLIEIYRHANRECDLHGPSGVMQMFDALITTLNKDAAVTKSRNLISSLKKIKELGDTAAHSRTYITSKADVDDIKADARRCLTEMASLAGM